MNFDKFAFLDFGCGRGGSMVWARNVFYGNGLGIDKSKSRVDEAIRNGCHAVVGDILKLPDRKLVEFVVMSHFLEHLPGRPVAEQMIAKAVTVARKFVVIVQPFFDADDFLARNGMKFYWSDWPTGHRYKMHSRELMEILSALKTEKKICGFNVGFRMPIKSSLHPAIHSLDSPSDQHDWNPRLHPPKPFGVKFRNIFRETVAYIAIDSGRFSYIDKLQIDNMVY